jgi:chlorite dismutase
MPEEDLPPVPLTLEGSSILHQMFRIRWAAWKELRPARRAQIVKEAVAVLEKMEGGNKKESALFSLLGHKGDLMLVHFRRTLEELNGAELSLGKHQLADFLEPAGSYLSIVELGLYEASVQLYEGLIQKGERPGTPEWSRALEAEMTRQKESAAPRLWPEIPSRRYVCFYPMDKRRGETKNWYQLSIRERWRMMREHGMIGRRYAGQVVQIISGSVGLDDWEWGVDLFADDPLVFKKLVYEMRFDEASAVYGLFGTFYVGLRFPAANLGLFMEGQTPGFNGRR